ncbi:fatty-acid amide hydrolase [Thozetella sp. PMI_491]|nr:fatty-acid amide hydrolase [Thozetella sp. PMI_491]
MGSVDENNWRQAVAVKQRERLAAIPKDWLLSPSLVSQFDLSETSNTNVISIDFVRKSGILSDQEIAITENFTAPELISKIATGEFSSELVTTAYAKRSALAQQLTNCLTEIFYDRALERARFLDNYLKTNKTTIGPLHGLPVSLKDSFNYKGIPSTLGFVGFLKHAPPKENSVLTDMLLDLGAVLYVKTNIPQALGSSDSHNNVFGRTLNPHNLGLTAGGSSGGESALVAYRGAPIGVGTDLGGSIRMPAASTGVYGFKPSCNRIPYGKKTRSAPGGFHNVSGCAGPLCNNFEEIGFFMKTIIAAQPWQRDSTSLAYPWRELPELSRPLTIGVLAEDPKYPLHPPVRRALSAAAEKLGKAGHKIVQLGHTSEHSISVSNDLIFKYYAVDPDQTIMKVIRDAREPVVPSLAKMNTFGSLEAIPSGDIRELAEMNRLRAGILEYWRTVFVGSDLDVILAPPSQCTAVQHDCWNWIPYTASFNLVDFPALIIPFMKVSKEWDSEPFSPGEGQLGPQYVADLLDGAPCSIQVVARNLHDEECLRAAKAIDKVLKQ